MRVTRSLANRGLEGVVVQDRPGKRQVTLPARGITTCPYLIIFCLYTLRKNVDYLAFRRQMDLGRGQIPVCIAAVVSEHRT